MSSTSGPAPAVIAVAITGSVPRKKDNPAVPVTPAEQVESTHEAFEAGGVHLVAAPVDYSDNLRILVDELHSGVTASAGVPQS